jgi:hypothetical protein
MAHRFMRILRHGSSGLLVSGVSLVLTRATTRREKARKGLLAAPEAPECRKEVKASQKSCHCLPESLQGLKS